MPSIVLYSLMPLLIGLGNHGLLVHGIEDTTMGVHNAVEQHSKELWDSVVTTEQSSAPLTVDTNAYPPEEQEAEFPDFHVQQNDSRVNGGRPVTQLIPYQVSLQRQHGGSSWSHFCGGSIISPEYVLTAAHCLDKVRVENVSVVCGTLTWRRGGQRHRVVAKHLHPKFTMSSGVINDVALIKVVPPFELNQRSISAISLAGPSRVGDRTPVRLSGWGSVNPTPINGLPEQLQMLDYHTISNAECRRRGFRVTPNELCALGRKGKGACVGDSGGPLVIVQGVPQLVGIVSYGTSRCAQGKPDVYTRVSSFLPFINGIVNPEQE